jgi:hypothetical protein
MPQVENHEFRDPLAPLKRNCQNIYILNDNCIEKLYIL